MTTKTKRVKSTLSKTAKENSRRVHITPRSNGWAVRKEGNFQASRIVKTQKEAITIGKKWVKEGKSTTVIIHDRNGRFRSS